MIFSLSLLSSYRLSTYKFLFILHVFFLFYWVLVNFNTQFSLRNSRLSVADSLKCTASIKLRHFNELLLTKSKQNSNEKLFITENATEDALVQTMDVQIKLMLIPVHTWAPLIHKTFCKKTAFSSNQFNLDECIAFLYLYKRKVRSWTRNVQTNENIF